MFVTVIYIEISDKFDKKKSNKYILCLYVCVCMRIYIYIYIRLSVYCVCTAITSKYLINLIQIKQICLYVYICIRLKSTFSYIIYLYYIKIDNYIYWKIYVIIQISLPLINHFH